MSLTPQHLNRRLASIALAATMLVVPAAAVSGQQPVQAFVDLSTSALTLRDSVVAIAKAQVGRKYVLGGTTPNRGFDCSGLVRYVLKTLQVDVPRTSREQAKAGMAIPRDQSALRPGDLLLFGKTRGEVSHVGIYIGDGRYVHASSVAGRVIESRLDRKPSALVKMLTSARRILATTDVAAPTDRAIVAASTPLALVASAHPLTHTP